MARSTRDSQVIDNNNLLISRFNSKYPPHPDTGAPNADELLNLPDDIINKGLQPGLGVAEESLRQDRLKREGNALEIKGVQGELFPEDKKPSTNPRAESARKKRNRTRGDDAQRRAEEARGGERLKPEDIWPNYPNMLKIIPEVLKLLPMLTGVNRLAELDQDSPMWPNLKGAGVDVPRYLDDEEYGEESKEWQPDMAQGYRDNKAGNVDEVWKIRNHPNYKSLPSEKQLQQNILKIRDMLAQVDYSDIPNEFDKILNPTGSPNPPRPSLDQLRDGYKYKKSKGLV